MVMHHVAAPPRISTASQSSCSPETGWFHAAPTRLPAAAVVRTRESKPNQTKPSDARESLNFEEGTGIRHKRKGTSAPEEKV
jgi:hypothetical protein